MCNKPIYVTIRPKVFQIGDFQGKSYEMAVPCGQCSACLKKRQGEYRSRVLLNSQKFPYCYFVTLTYNEENVPIYQRIFEVSKETGEIKNAEATNEAGDYIRTGAILSRDFESYRLVRSRLNECSPHARVRSYYEDVDYGFGVFRYVFSDSLDYSDIQKFYKRLRSKLSYDLGEDCPKLSYLTCGEYGPVTHRPHYHLLLMFDAPVKGLKRIIKECWQLGFSDFKMVACTKEDFGKVGSYISKYIVKGKANEEQSAIDGFCVKPRVRSSLKFGTYLTNEQIAFLRCYDLYGSYSMFEPEKILNDENKKTTLFTEMGKRFRCLFASSSTPVTKPLLKRLFAVRTPSNNLCWSPLYLEFRNFTRELVVARNEQMYRQYCSDYGYTENTLDSFVAFEHHKEVLASVTEEKFKKDTDAFYKRSKV